MTDNPTATFFKEVVNTINDGVFLVGPDGRIEMVNPALERLTGYTKDELIGQTCAVLNCDACKRARQLGKEHWCGLFLHRTENRKKCTIRRKDGTRMPVLKNAKVLMDNGEVVAAVETITDITDVVERDRKIEALSRLLGTEQGFAGMVGNSPAMQRAYKIIERAADSDAPVIIFGASGTGKELAAQAIHNLGPRQSGPMVQLNCAALNESLLESELFGHVKGAFTGAVQDREGRFEAASGGDIFLDEIGDIPMPIQVKLLRVLETKKIERVGSNQSLDVDVRFISATHRDLNSLVQQRNFREDLLFRINVIPIRLPLLKERREDIPLLAEHFLVTIRERTNKDVGNLSPEAMHQLMAYDWPGNVRELRSAMEYAFVLAGHGRIEEEHLPVSILGEPLCASVTAETSPAAMETLSSIANVQVSPEKQKLLDALRQANGNMSEAARLLGVHRGTIRNRMLKWGVDIRRDIFSG